VRRSNGGGLQVQVGELFETRKSISATRDTTCRGQRQQTNREGPGRNREGPGRAVTVKLVLKLRNLGLNPSLSNWILDFRAGRLQVVTLSTGAPQGCILSPLLYALYMYDCGATHSSNTILKFVDDTTILGLITKMI